MVQIHSHGSEGMLYRMHHRLPNHLLQMTPPCLRAQSDWGHVTTVHLVMYTRQYQILKGFSEKLFNRKFSTINDNKTFI